MTGYVADLLPNVCRVYLDANEAGVVKNKRQGEIVDLARTIYHGLATYGIYRLIDDVTGFSRYQARSELQKVLSAYVSPALLPWNPKFPEAFYEQLHRVRGWPYRPGNHHRNGYIGKLTRALIYEPLPDGVIQKLEEKNPYISEKKGRKYRHFQYLTEEIGNPHLEKQISIVTTLLTISDTWDEFLKHCGRAFPVKLGLFSLPPPPPEAAN